MATVAIATMKVAQVSKPGTGIQVLEREIPEPGAGHVRIKVQACGVCHSDALTVEGAWPGIQYPRVPGHEVAGVIDEVGAGVSEWRKGQRAGVGWHGGHDNLPGVPAWRLSQLPESKNCGHQLRRRIPAIHAGAGRSAGCDSGEPERRRCGASALRVNYHV
jgi:NADPH:quinone reductase-like Zn-dependent oxidoreductase